MAQVDYFRGAWSSGIAAGTAADPLGVTATYRQRNIVTHGGNLYVYISSTSANSSTPGTDDAVWQNIGPLTATSLTTEQLAVVNANPFTDR